MNTQDTKQIHTPRTLQSLFTNTVTHPKVRLKRLPLVMGLLATASTTVFASDLEIYQSATNGGATIMMMLDTSGSMDPRSIGEDYSNQGFSLNAYNGLYYCNASRDRRGTLILRNQVSTDTLSVDVYDDNGEVTTTQKSYTVSYCVKDNKKYYDRISRLKMALMPFFANPATSLGVDGGVADLTKYKIGLGNFFYRTQGYGGGKIEAPALSLILDNRKNLLDKIAAMQANSNTPTAHAYAEAGAYMLGTNTSGMTRDTRVVERGVVQYRNSRYYLYRCAENSYPESTDDWWTQSSPYAGYYTQRTETWYGCNISYSRDSYVDVARTVSGLDFSKIGNPNHSSRKDPYSSLTYYGDRQTKLWVDYATSGFDLSADNTKDASKSNYQTPITSRSAAEQQCDGYGVYFLTDGEPNNSFSAATALQVMNMSLGSGPKIGNTSATTCTSGLTSSGSLFENSTSSLAPQWECIGEYAKALNSENNVKSTAIMTAAVGFGKTFEQIINAGKEPREITLPNGKRETVQVYKCDASNINSVDAQNLCKLGEKSYGYGEGGFYYTQEPEEIAASIKSFINDVGRKDIDPVSTGSMSAPLDSLSGFKSRKYAYLPILEPDLKTQNLWSGNLKKYNVANATLKGADDNFVFSDANGLFAKNTHDLWNTIRDQNRTDAKAPDNGLPQVGGTYQKVFENTTPSRNLFVNSAGSLKGLSVSPANKPVNFTGLSSSYTQPQKRTLMNFMGYSVPDTHAIEDATELPTGVSFSKASKNIGAVLHSVPQLLTTKIEIKSDGSFDQSKRKDYLLYGSMDGALHLIDDSDGTEMFTFIPKQILDLQPAAIEGRGAAIDGSYPFGVDAPWLVYTDYKNKSTTTGTGAAATTTNTYESAQSFALGGLRMGGSMYYGLNITNIQSPSLMFSVGSNYANRLKGVASTVEGVKNDVAADTADQAAYSRMGETWAKPALGYVKSGGKRVMVSFLPGGYDRCYENPKFKLNTTDDKDSSCSNKSTAQGNAIYMVQVGEEQTNSNNETTVNSNNSGKLLWWATNGSGRDSTSRSSGMQASKHSDLKHSIVTQVRALDRNYDGLTDHIYFADLGGQVWRVDINNTDDHDNFKIDRVVKVLDVSDQVGTGDAPPRFYERPLVTFYNDTYAFKDSNDVSGSHKGVMAMVTVGTGDRSNPVSSIRKKADALYTFIDKDITRKDLFHYDDGTTAPDMYLRTPNPIKVAGSSNYNDKLQQLTFTAADAHANSGIQQQMKANGVQGWYMPFTHWLGNDAATGGKYKIKMFNEPDALASVLISSTYNPDAGNTANNCSAGIKGKTQRERSCLPYGVCLDASGNPETTSRATFDAGSGIVDNIITQYNDTSVFTSIKTRCEGDDCEPDIVCPDGDCDNLPPPFNACTGEGCDTNVGIRVDDRINPLSWMEH